MRSAADFRQFAKYARADIEHQRDARRRGRSIEGSDFLRGAILEQTEIILRESANLRSIGQRDSAGYLHEGDARTDGPFPRSGSCSGGRIFRGGMQFAGNQVSFQRNAVAQWLGARKFL